MGLRKINPLPTARELLARVVPLLIVGKFPIMYPIQLQKRIYNPPLPNGCRLAIVPALLRIPSGNGAIPGLLIGQKLH